MLDFHFLSSASVLASHYSASVSSFPSLPGFTSQRFSRCALPLSLLRFSLSLRPDLSCLPSSYKYSAFCLFPFILPSFAPTAVPLVLPFFSGSLRPLLFRAFPFFFRFLSSASFPVLTTQPSVLPFPFFPFLPLSGFFGAPLSLSFLRFSPFSPAWSPVRSFPVPVLGFLFVSFRPSSLRFPQLFHECFPFAFAFGLFRFPSGSFRPLLFRLRLLSLLLLPFRFFLSPPHSRLPQCSASALASSVFPVLPSLVSHAFFPGSSYSAFCSFPFILPGFAPTAVPPVLPFFSAFFRPLLFRAFLLAFCFLSSASARF